jgi:hypothetical protein
MMQLYRSRKQARTYTLWLRIAISHLIFYTLISDRPRLFLPGNIAVVRAISFLASQRGFAARASFAASTLGSAAAYAFSNPALGDGFLATAVTAGTGAVDAAAESFIGFVHDVFPLKVGLG